MAQVRDETCEVHYIDEAKVKTIAREMPAEPRVTGLAETFKVLGDPTRLRIIFALSREELCVCDLAALLGLSASAVSHQLRLLRTQRLVKHRKAGQMVFYSLEDEHILNLFDQGLVHVDEATGFSMKKPAAGIRLVAASPEQKQRKVAR